MTNGDAHTYAFQLHETISGMPEGMLERGEGGRKLNDEFNDAITIQHQQPAGHCEQQEAALAAHPGPPAMEIDRQINA